MLSLTASAGRPQPALQQPRPNTGALRHHRAQRPSLLTVRGQPTPEERRGDSDVEASAIEKAKASMGGGPKVRVVGTEGEDQAESNKGGFFGGAGDAIKDAIDNAGDTLSGVGKDAQDNASKAGDSAGEAASDDGGNLLDKLGIGEKADKGTMTTDGDN